MIIPPKRPYLVTIEEPYDGQDIRVKHAEFIVNASTIQEACNEMELYFGMGIKIKILKCELMG